MTPLTPLQEAQYRLDDARDAHERDRMLFDHVVEYTIEQGASGIDWLKKWHFNKLSTYEIAIFAKWREENL
jgi:hypothetical protein